MTFFFFTEFVKWRCTLCVNNSVTSNVGKISTKNPVRDKISQNNYKSSMKLKL